MRTLTDIKLTPAAEGFWYAEHLPTGAVARYSQQRGLEQSQRVPPSETVLEGMSYLFSMLLISEFCAQSGAHARARGGSA
jgi:hypothetical protein